MLGLQYLKTWAIEADPDAVLAVFFLLRGIDDRGAIPAKIQVKVSADDPSRSSYDLLEQLYVSRWEFGTNVNGFGCGFVGPEKN